MIMVLAVFKEVTPRPYSYGGICDAKAWMGRASPFTATSWSDHRIMAGYPVQRRRPPVIMREAACDLHRWMAWNLRRYLAVCWENVGLTAAAGLRSTLGCGDG
jgi:hypothetical protein